MDGFLSKPVVIKDMKDILDRFVPIEKQPCTYNLINDGLGGRDPKFDDDSNDDNIFCENTWNAAGIGLFSPYSIKKSGLKSLSGKTTKKRKSTKRFGMGF